MATGPRSAVLELPHGSHSYEVHLDALVRPGTTGLTMKSQPGDFIGQGQNSSFTPANASFRFLASPSGLGQALTANDGQTWTVDMYPAPGQVLAMGFIQHCEGATPALTGEVKYDAEPGTAPPAGVTNLKAVVTSSGLDITWDNPTTSLYAYTVVRLEPSGTPADVSPTAGDALFAGAGTMAGVHGLQVGQTYIVVAYTVDKYGNVSAPVEPSVAF